MALNTYDNLKLAISDWSDRDDYSSDNLDEFIDLTEALLRRAPQPSRSGTLGGIRANKQVTTGTISGDSITLPTDWLEGDYLTLTTTPRCVLEFVAPEFLQQKNRTGTGRPRLWTVEDAIYLDVTADSAYGYQLGYWPVFGALTSTNTSNWVLANFPDVYLHGCLYQAACFVKDSDAQSKHASAYRDAAFGANLSYRRSISTSGPIRSHASGSTP